MHATLVFAVSMALALSCGSNVTGKPTTSGAEAEAVGVHLPKDSTGRGQRGAGAKGATAKVLVFVEENSSRRQMRAQMPFLAGMSRRYSFAQHYTALTHPSLPNYLALVGGSTFGVHDDNPPAYHPIFRRSVFDQAINAGKSARTYAESMPRNCALMSAGRYAVKHNPWTYFVNSRRRCRSHDVPLGRPRIGALHSDIRHATLPNVGLVVPNACHDAHDCSLALADRWLQRWLRQVLRGRDFTSGRLTVIVTADEDDGNARNKVLTVVLHAGMRHEVVRRPLTHYSLLGYLDQVLGVPLLGQATPGFARAFGL
jgi:phosphatidylinositol-3-phosphatase